MHNKVQELFGNEKFICMVRMHFRLSPEQTRKLNQMLYEKERRFSRSHYSRRMECDRKVARVCTSIFDMIEECKTIFCQHEPRLLN